MKLLAALKFVVELLTQLITLGEEGLGRIMERMNYIREITGRVHLPTIQEFTQFLDQAVGHIVDCDTDPTIPSSRNWTIERHIKGGKVRLERRGDTLYVDGKKVILHLVKQQTGDRVIRGYELRKELDNSKLVLLNANLLDYLLERPELIPDAWKGKMVFFWGTVHRRSDGDLNVRYLDWYGGRWDWYYDWLGYGWYSDSPAAVLASQN